jgi:betaine-homocysteine S-methyltransferase
VKQYMPGKAIAANLCIGPEGDLHGVSTQECAVRMFKAGAEIVGVNCHFDPFVSLKAMKLMKAGLEEAGLWNGPTKAPFLMCQPLAFMTPDAQLQGFIDLPEFPFGLEPRICTRWEMHRFAREAWEQDVRFIGGCCGFEPYHIRACAEELIPESGKVPKGCQKHLPWGEGLKMHTKPWVRARGNKEYWQCLCPSSGRPFCAAMSQPANWGITQGDEKLKQEFSTSTSAVVNTTGGYPAKKIMEDVPVPGSPISSGSSGKQPCAEPSPAFGPRAEEPCAVPAM